MIDDELQDWIDKSLNETATEEEARALEERLLGDAASSRSLSQRGKSPRLAATPVFAAEEKSSPVTRFPALPRRKFAIGLGIAASLGPGRRADRDLLAPSSQPTAVDCTSRWRPSCRWHGLRSPANR